LEEEFCQGRRSLEKLDEPPAPVLSGGEGITHIPTKKLISPIRREDDLDLPAGDLGDLIHRQGGGIPKGLPV
jgi:hypothetical protein